MPTPLSRALRRLWPAILAASLLVTAAAGPAAAAEPDPTAELTPAVASGDPGGDPEPTVPPEPEPTASPIATPTPDPDPSPVPSPKPSTGPDPTPAPTASPSPPDPDWPGRYNLYRSGTWVRQYWDYTCVAASTQTMLNLIRDRTDRSSVFQQRIIRYARNHDTLSRSRGSDPEGWASALRRFGGGPYDWRVFRTRAAALRYAATRMVVTGKPVGLLVWHGRHAWTMTGFRSATDPSSDRNAVVTGVYVAPPLKGVDPRPNAYLRTSSLGTFARYQERDGLRVWVGRWVVVAP